jgi:hypothetical protein
LAFISVYEEISQEKIIIMQSTVALGVGTKQALRGKIT